MIKIKQYEMTITKDKTAWRVVNFKQILYSKTKYEHKEKGNGGSIAV